jgi:hypothetical protein
MNKINSLKSISGIPEEPTSQKDKDARVDRAKQKVKPDSVEISAKARAIQKTEEIQQKTLGELTEDAKLVGDQWYTVGYTLPGSEE